jgi:hypothetical protein
MRSTSKNQSHNVPRLASFFGMGLMMIIASPVCAACHTEPGPGCYYRGGQCLDRVVCTPDYPAFGAGPPVDSSVFSRAARTPYGPDLEAIKRMQLMDEQIRQMRGDR